MDIEKSIKNRIDKKFEELGKTQKKALIAFVTAGDPDMQQTVGIVKEMVAAGADIIELGVPFSDPIAEGPVIQAANARALSGGFRIEELMRLVRELRKEIDNPLLYLLYFNTILQYGIAEFMKECGDSGIDGLIIPDLPYEEREEIDNIANENGIYVITLVAPTSKERVCRIAKDAKGFVYCVSSLGVTGVRSSFDTDFNEFFSYINSTTPIPKAIGFGISTAEHVRSLKGFCDGLIVGSAIVRLVSEAPAGSAAKAAGKYIKTLRDALDE